MFSICSIICVCKIEINESSCPAWSLLSSWVFLLISFFKFLMSSTVISSVTPFAQLSAPPCLTHQSHSLTLSHTSSFQFGYFPVTSLKAH